MSKTTFFFIGLLIMLLPFWLGIIAGRQSMVRAQCTADNGPTWRTLANHNEEELARHKQILDRCMSRLQRCRDGDRGEE